uniref:Uncharacterized protein n=1 Tax=Brassica oleracea var. oleracea TaxID=109376 RepID=A0A0D2ZSJ1_BRAOL
MMKALKDISKSHKKSTSTRAPVAEPSLIISEKPKELTVLQPEHPSSLVLSQQVFEEEPLDYPHQGPRLDTRNPLDENLGKMDLRSNPFQEGGNDAPRIIDPGQDDATMAEPDDSSTKDKTGWINGENTDVKPAGETEDELEPAEESMHELKPAKVRVDELDELSELSDTNLELDELTDTTLELSDLSNTEYGAGLAAGRNEPFFIPNKNS